MSKDAPVFRFNKLDDSLETICTTPVKVDDKDKENIAASSSKKTSFKDAFRSYSVEESGIDTNQSTKTWRMIKDKVAQAVEDYKSNRSTKDDDSDVDDFSEASVKTDNMPNNLDEATPSLIGKSLSSFRNRKKQVFSKLSKSKDASPAKMSQKVKDTTILLNDDLLLKSQIDVESGVEVSEDMVLLPSMPQNDDESFITVSESNEIRLTSLIPPMELIPSIENEPSLSQPLIESSDILMSIVSFLLQIFIKESFLFGLLSILVTLGLKLSPFWQGALTMAFLMLLYRNVCDYLKESVLKKSLPSITLNRNISNSLFPTLFEGIEEHRPIKTYRGWMNFSEKYDPENYHVSQTQSVYIKIDGSSLRLSFTKSKVSKRHLWNESTKSRYAKNFSHHRCYDLTGATVELWPRGLARKRYFSRKYPIRITFLQKDQKTEELFNYRDSLEDDSETGKQFEIATKYVDLNKIEADDDFRDCTEEGLDLIYLFARCDREKEDWLRQFRAASIGDIHDCSDEPNVKSRESSKSSSLATTPTKDVFRDASCGAETKKRDSNSSTSRDGDDFERIEKESFTFDTLILPCASRSSADFVQFVKSYIRKSSDKKSNDIEWYTGYDFSQPLNLDVYWINLVIGRFLYGIIHDSSILDEMQTFFQRKLSAIKLPNFMEEVSIAEINLASSTPPVIHKIYPPSMDERGVWIDADLTYEGLVHATISTKLNLMRLKKQEGQGDPIEKLYSKSAPVETIYDSEAESESSSESDEDTSSIATDTNTEIPTTSTSPVPAKKKRLLRIVNKITTSNLFQSATEIPYIQRAMENMSTNIKLRVELKGIISRVVINLPSPPSDRLWLGFREPPRLFVSAKPTIGESLFDWNIVTSAIENKLCDEIYKQMVYPNLIDVIIPLLGQPTYKE